MTQITGDLSSHPSCPRCWISIPEGYNVLEPKASTFDNNSLGLQSNMACWKIPVWFDDFPIWIPIEFGNFLAGMFDYQTVRIYIYTNKHLYQAWLITHWYNNIRYAMVFPYIYMYCIFCYILSNIPYHCWLNSTISPFTKRLIKSGRLASGPRKYFNRGHMVMLFTLRLRCSSHEWHRRFTDLPLLAEYDRINHLYPGRCDAKRLLGNCSFSPWLRPIIHPYFHWKYTKIPCSKNFGPLIRWCLTP